MKQPPDLRNSLRTHRCIRRSNPNSHARLRLAVAVLALVETLTIPLQADDASIVAAFETIRAQTVFPVSGKGLDDVEETFGPRIQPSTSNYDFHRGIDIDGVGGESVVAVADGRFYDYTVFASGGYTLRLEHDLPSPFVHGPNGRTISKYYTLYMHLTEDGIGGTTTTDDFIQANGWVAGSPIPRGTALGVLGSSGQGPGEAYAPHLHFELRVGAMASLEFQLANPGTTQYGFDPHMHPLLLFAPAPALYTQSLTLVGGAVAGQDITVAYALNSDDLPILNRVEVVVRDGGTAAVVASHTLDFNARVGYDASSTATLDARDFTKPYLSPGEFLDDATTYTTSITVPGAFTTGLGADLDIEITAKDLWGESTSLAFTAVPEPASAATWVAIGLCGAAAWRGRRTRQANHASRLPQER